MVKLCRRVVKTSQCTSVLQAPILEVALQIHPGGGFCANGNVTNFPYISLHGLQKSRDRTVAVDLRVEVQRGSKPWAVEEVVQVTALILKD